MAVEEFKPKKLPVRRAVIVVDPETGERKYIQKPKEKKDEK